MTCRWRAPLALALALAAVSACGTEPEETAAPEAAPPAAAPAPAARACDLLTSADLTEVLEAPATVPVPDGSGCVHQIVDSDEGDGAVVSVHFELGDVRPLALLAQYQTTLRSTLGEYESMEILGVGDAAIWDGTALAAAVSLDDARSAFVAVQIHDDVTPIDSLLAQARDLMERALERLRAGDSAPLSP